MSRSKAETMRKSGETSIRMVHMRLHAKYQDGRGLLLQCNQWSAKLMAAAEIGDDDPSGFDGPPGLQWVAHE